MSTLPAVVDQGTDIAHVNRELDATVANSVNTGVFTREDAQKHYRYSDGDMDRALAPPPSLASVNKELEAIDRLRRTDKNAYFKDEAIQKKERDLLALREKLTAKGAPAVKADSEYDGSDLPEELRDQWERQAGVAHHLRVAQETARAALDTLEPDEAADLQASFDMLPESARTSIFGFLAVEPGRWRPAREEEIAAFRESDCAELADAWGSQAAKKIGVVRGRLKMMLGAMKPAERAATEAWFDDLSPSQAMAVMRALAK